MVIKLVEEIAPLSETEKVHNSLSTMIEGLQFGAQLGIPGAGGTAQVANSTFTQYLNLRYYLISNQPMLLSQMYVEKGIVQTLCDQPVDDALRAGYTIKSGQIDGDENELLQKWMLSSGAWAAFIQATKWKRLYGGAGVFILDSKKAATPFNIERINKYTPIGFKAASMWELYKPELTLINESTISTATARLKADYYTYYGVDVDPSRVLKLVGKEPPYYIRQQLRGWGMSSVEPVLRSLNTYEKNMDVIFDLLDEAKIDIFKIDGFNSSMINANGTAAVGRRVQMANMLKNYNNALTMDMKDDYAQKTMNFAGLADMLEQVRISIAADLKMPLTKLFGISAAGFSSGEDDIENYNSMLESEIRAKSHDDVIKLLQIGCKQLFDFIPDDLQIIFNPLRILSAEEEEKVKDSQWKRVKEGYENGLVQDLEAKESANADSLFGVEIDANAPADDPLAAKSANAIQLNDPKESDSNKSSPNKSSKAKK